MQSKYTKIFLVIIIALASFLRLWQLGNVPISPDWDEVALGYDAYSIIKTGRDEFGNFLPVVLRSFDDYKPALYTYLTIPSVLIFGLTAFATRLPSAIFGILTVLAVYFLVKELFKRLDIALLSAFLLSISPWHIQFSRIAFESNIGLAFNVFTALFFIKGLKRPWLLSLSAVCATLSIYAYQSEKVFTPLLVGALVLIYSKDLIRIPRKFLLSAVIFGLIFITPMATYIITNKEALLRAQATLAFSDKTTFLKDNIMRLQVDKENSNLIGQVIDNRRVLYLKTGISGYLSHFDLNWLFITGDINRHHAPGMGLLYLWELPFVLAGIYLLIFYKSLGFNRKSAYLILTWFLLAPVPAAFTSGVPHAVRTLNFLPTFQIFTAIGILGVGKVVLSIRYKILSIRTGKLLITIYSIFVIFNFGYYLNQYFVQQNYAYAYDWQYGYEEAVPIAEQLRPKYREVVVSDREPLDKSYMFFLFYLKYPPEQFQKIGQFSSGGFGKEHFFENYKFRLINWEEDSKKKGVLYIGTPKEFPENIKPIKTIYYPNKEKAILFVES